MTATAGATKSFRVIERLASHRVTASVLALAKVSRARGGGNGDTAVPPPAHGLLGDVEAAQGDEVAGLLYPGLLGLDLLAHRVGEPVFLPARAGGLADLDRFLRELDAVGIGRFPHVH